ncbi:hypothetical protein ACFYTF_04590 [Nocardia thailandica]|uniref:Uncharacterized protein n=1 Tax=Nocardia thailandica TaxID=257275 RepID=A0ABW6PI72_9NOCA
MPPLTIHRHGYGFRLDGLRDDGRIGFYGAPDADPRTCPTIGSRPNPHEWQRWTPAAFCVSYIHISPDPDCVCGWRVCARVTDLAGLPSGSGLDVSLRANDDIADRPIVAEVAAWGPTLPGVSDPPGTVRTTWLRLESRIWVRRDIPRPLARKVSRRYPWATVGRFGDLDELATAVDIDGPA